MHGGLLLFYLIFFIWSFHVHLDSYDAETWNKSGIEEAEKGIWSDVQQFLLNIFFYKGYNSVL